MNSVIFASRSEHHCAEYHSGVAFVSVLVVACYACPRRRRKEPPTAQLAFNR